MVASTSIRQDHTPGESCMDSTITVKNAHIGDRVVSSEEVLSFPFGIPGFEQERRFVLVDDADFEPFQWLVSTENPDATFLVCSPYTIVPDYTFQMDDAIVDQLQAEKPEDITVVCIVTLRRRFEDSTINLKAPIVMNRNKGRGRQLVLQRERYNIRHPMFFKERPEYEPQRTIRIGADEE